MKLATGSQHRTTRIAWLPFSPFPSSIYLRLLAFVLHDQRAIMTDLNNDNTKDSVAEEGLSSNSGRQTPWRQTTDVKTNSLVTEDSHSSAVVWQPGWRQTPWLTMASILMMLVCMGASAGILIVSDRQVVDTWMVQPAVILALLSAVWNYSLDIMLARSVVVMWWRNALRGTKLEILHYIWDQGANPFYALRSSLDMWKVVLMTWLIFSVQIINSPMLQRANRIKGNNVAVQELLTLDIAPSLPDGFFGKVLNATRAHISGSRDGISIAQDWWWNRTISSSNKTGYQCDGTCIGQVRGTGIDHDCSSTTILMDLSARENDGQGIFAINTRLTSAGAPILILTTLYVSAVDDSCIATLASTTCRIEAAIVEYPVQVQNATITLQVEKLQNVTVVNKYISPGDLATATRGQGAGPLEGLNDFLGSYLYANVTLVISGNQSFYNGLGGIVPDLFFVPDDPDYDARILHKCSLKWSDPTQYVLNSMYHFLFLASLSASSGRNSQTFSVQRAHPVLVFHSDYNYLAAALTVMLLFRLWGWWELGQDLSLSPLVLAKAFRAPLMQRVGDNLAVPVILKLAGKTRVRYDGESISEIGAERWPSATSNTGSSDRLAEGSWAKGPEGPLAGGGGPAAVSETQTAKVYSLEELENATK